MLVSKNLVTSFKEPPAQQRGARSAHKTLEVDSAAMEGQAAPAIQGGGHHCPLSPDILTMSSAPGAPYPPTKPPITSPGPAWSPVAAEPFSTWPSKVTPSCPPAPTGGTPDLLGWFPQWPLLAPRPQTHFLQPLPGVWGGVPHGVPHAPTPDLTRLVKEESGGPSHGGQGVRPGRVPRLPGGNLICIRAPGLCGLVGGTSPTP